MKKIMTKNMYTILFVILVFVSGIIMVYFNQRNADTCKNNGGKVITNEWGYFEKCIYEVDK